MLFEDLTGFCPWHKKDSSFEQVHQVRYATPEFAEHTVSFSHPIEERHATRTGILIFRCTYCKQSVVVLEFEIRLPSKDVGGEEEHKITRRMISPHQAARELHGSAPTPMRSMFAEASTCEQAGAFRAAGVMYRAAVEELVKDQKATGPKLWHQIESLKGTLSDELVEDLHEARMLGNDSIHEGIRYSAEEVKDVAELIQEAVLVLYVQPEQKRSMREARKARRNAQ